MPKLFTLFLFAFAVNFAAAQGPPKNWTEPLDPVHIVANLYYVGTQDLGVYLIATPEGHFLVNSGLQDSTALIRDSIAKAGFKLADVKILLTMQAHYDHVAALAEIKQLTGAQLYATAGDKPVLEDGGRSDYHLGPAGYFPPVKVDRTIEHLQRITLGGTTLTVHLHPGHTKGSVSYAFEVTEGGKKYSVLLANMGSVNPGVALRGNKKYPQIAEDYQLAFDRQMALKPDIWVAAHASQCSLHAKWKPGQVYSPEAFVDPKGYHDAVSRYETAFLKDLSAQSSALAKLETRD